MGNAVIIANKGAGSFSQQKLDSVSAALERGRVLIQQKVCSDFSEMTETAASISSVNNGPLIIAAGGDGTINAVLSGLAGNNTSCAILPFGTANALAIELDVIVPDRAVEKIIRGELRSFTAGIMKNQERSSRFFLAAGVGLDGSVVRSINLRTKKLLGKGAYVLSILRHSLLWEKSELVVTADNREFSCHTVVACNASRYAGAFTLAPNASIFSPTMEFVALKGKRRRDFFSLGSDILRGISRESESVIRGSFAELRVEGKKPVQVDGDDWGDSPVEIFTEPDYAKIIV